LFSISVTGGVRVIQHPLVRSAPLVLEWAEGGKTSSPTTGGPCVVTRRFENFGDIAKGANDFPRRASPGCQLSPSGLMSLIIIKMDA